MSTRKRWGLASIVTGVVFAAVGVVVFVTTETPVWLGTGLSVLEFILGALGVGLLAKPEPPA
jgi:mannose/fructose/N-acetylgalactosamine-specific phosphotransferase system component IIC